MPLVECAMDSGTKKHDRARVRVACRSCGMRGAPRCPMSLAATDVGTGVAVKRGGLTGCRGITVVVGRGSGGPSRSLNCLYPQSESTCQVSALCSTSCMVVRDRRRPIAMATERSRSAATEDLRPALQAQPWSRGVLPRRMQVHEWQGRSRHVYPRREPSMA